MTQLQDTPLPPDRRFRLPLLLAGGLLAALLVVPTGAELSGSVPATASTAAAPELRPLPTRTGGEASAGAGQRAVDASPTWLPGQLLVGHTAGTPPSELAAAVGGRLLQAPLAGLAVIELSPGMDRSTALETLQGHPAVTHAGPHARTRGAFLGGLTSALTPDHTQLQWHLPAAGLEDGDGGDVLVAVLDTGVAHRDAAVLGADLRLGVYSRASSLAHTPQEPGWDAVDGSDSPDDEHWHGTHIATSLLGDGDVRGAAPGAALLPVRVLDADNTGTEAMLIAGLHAAVDRGAEVINLSLSFGPDYRPSAPLLEALERAHEAGVVMVGAAGNSARRGATWPAASRHVAAVGALCLDERGGLEPAPYSHVGSELAVWAPGGCLDQDNNEDGHPDGILAESVAPGLPALTQLYWAEGTSQAAALVSGAAASLLAEGADPDAVLATLRARGQARSDGAVALQLSGGTTAAAPAPLAVALLPWIHEDAAGRTPHLRVVVVDEAGQLVDGVTVHGDVLGASEGALVCTTAGGLCDAAGPTVADHESAAWTLRVGRLVAGEQAQVPHQLWLGTAQLDEVRSLLTDELGGVPHVGFELEAGVFPGAMESLSFVSPEWGRVSAPTAAVMTPDWIDQSGLVLTDDSNGSGLASSPMGVKKVERADSSRGPSRDGGGSATVKGSSAAGHPSAPLIGTFLAPCLGEPGCGVEARSTARLSAEELPVAGDLDPVALALPGELLGVVSWVAELPLLLRGD